MPPARAFRESYMAHCDCRRSSALRRLSLLLSFIFDVRLSHNEIGVATIPRHAFRIAVVVAFAFAVALHRSAPNIEFALHAIESGLAPIDDDDDT